MFPPPGPPSPSGRRCHVIAVGKTNAKGLRCSGLSVADHPDAEVDGLRFIGVGQRDAADVARRSCPISKYPVISTLRTWYGAVPR